MRRRPLKRPPRAGTHDGCEACDLYVHPEHRGVCPSCKTPTTKCHGPEHAGTPFAGCVACYHGEERAHDLACRLGGGKFWRDAELEARRDVLRRRIEERGGSIE